MPPPPSGEIPKRLGVPDHVLYGRPAADALPELLCRLGRSRALLMVSRTLRAQTPVVSDIERALGGVCAGLYEGMPAHTPRSAVIECAAQARSLRADVLVTIGGGSLTDAAKAVQMALAYGITEEGDMDRLARAKAPYPELAVRYVAVPTTLSAGEFTSFAGVTDTRRRRKEGYFHPHCAPQAVVLDPAATTYTPEWLWLSTGMRAVDHCVESLCSLPAGAGGQATPYGDALAVAGLSLLARGLQRCKADPGDLAARLECQLGSFFAVEAAGVNKCGASHAIGHILGGTFDVPHGYTSCVALHGVLRWNAPVNGARQELVSSIFGRPGVPAADVVRDFVVSLGMPTTLAEVKVGEADIELAAKNTMRDRGVRDNPRKIASWQDVAEILRLILGPRPAKL